jgi:hypothetical protein
MPPLRTSRNRKPPPDGFEDIEDTLLEFSNKLKDAENASHEGKKKHEMVWPVFQITHQRSKYIYDLYYEKEAITKPLYDWLLKNNYADKNLIAKWKKQGYEKVCIHCFASCTCPTANPSLCSFAVSAASRPTRPISTVLASVAYLESSSRKIKSSNASTVVVEVVEAVTRCPRLLLNTTLLPRATTHSISVSSLLRNETFNILIYS